MTRSFTRFLKYGTLLSTYALLVSVLLQIFARFFLANAPSWTEEASRLFFIYATAFASGLALKNRYYVHLEVFFNRFPVRFQRFLLMVIPLLVFALFLIISVFALQFISLGHREFSPSMKMRMSFAFLSILILGVSVSVYAFRDFWKALNKLNS